jgi:hypothetical protein
MEENNINRIEKKYLITKSQKNDMLKVVNKYMSFDKYHKSGVYNIYFDTDNYDLIIQSIDHPLFKQKLRARSYEGYDRVFLEIKTKILGYAYYHDFLEMDESDSQDNNAGFKRRIQITHQDYRRLVAKKTSAEALAKKKIEKPTDLQIAKEVDYMISYFDLKPKIFLFYNRESYIGYGDLRVTFDENLSYRKGDPTFRRKASDKKYFQDKRNIVMEIKAHGHMPIWLVKAMSKSHIYPEQFSKVGKIYERIKQEDG